MHELTETPKSRLSSLLQRSPQRGAGIEKLSCWTDLKVGTDEQVPWKGMESRVPHSLNPLHISTKVCPDLHLTEDGTITNRGLSWPSVTQPAQLS